MKILSSLFLASSLLMSANAAYADGFGFNIGPFSMQFNASDNDYVTSNRMVLDSPICYAISHQAKLEMIVEGAENVSTKESKIVTKKLVVEPYAFGITRDGKPVLRGNVIDEKLIREITVKFGEDEFDQSSVSSNQTNKGFFSGMFSSDKTRNIDVRKVADIRVVQNSHFDIPKNYKGFQDDNFQIICQLPAVQQK